MFTSYYENRTKIIYSETFDTFILIEKRKNYKRKEKKFVIVTTISTLKIMPSNHNYYLSKHTKFSSFLNIFLNCYVFDSVSMNYSISIFPTLTVSSSRLMLNKKVRFCLFHVFTRILVIFVYVFFVFKIAENKKKLFLHRSII